jgi:hypothetical protein
MRMKNSVTRFRRILLALLISSASLSSAQDTFSIVAVDSVTGEVGSAGASCVDLILFFPNYTTDFLGDLIPGQGAINTQASYNVTNQNNARSRMLAGTTNENHRISPINRGLLHFVPFFNSTVENKVNTR